MSKNKLYLQEDEDRWSNLGQMIGSKITKQLVNPIRPSLKQIPEEAQELAELVKISSVWDKSGKEAALKRLATTKKNYKIDPELSNSDYITFIKPNGKVVVAFRGTNPTRRITEGFGEGLIEPFQWLNIGTGTEEIYKQHQLTPIKNRLIQKYGINNIDKITGYSMGATKAHRLADELGVESTLFNPFLGKKFFSAPKAPNVKHQIYRTTEDIATLQALFTQSKALPPNVKVDSIDPVITVKNDARKIVKGLRGRDVYNVLYNHQLEHFTTTGDRNNLTREINDKIELKTNQFKTQTAGLDKNSEAFKSARKKFLNEIEPDMKLLSQDLEIVPNAKHKLFKSLSKANIIRSLAGLGAGVGVDQIIKSMEEATGVDVDEHINTAVSGLLGGTAEHGIERFLGFKTSLLKALGTGVAGALAQQVTSEGAKSLLKDVGASAETSEILSQTIGGGVGGFITAGGLQLSRQVALRLASRLAGGLGAEALATSLGASIGSAVPGFGTLLGIGIGALIGGIVSVIDVENRLHSPITNEERQLLNRLAWYSARNMIDMDEVINNIGDDIIQQRFRRFMEDPEYTDEIEYQKQQSEEKEKVRKEEIKREQTQTMMNKIRQESIINSFSDVLQNDPKFKNARNYQEANNRIMELIEQLRPDVFTSSGLTSAQYLIQSLITNGKPLIPQFDANGNMTFIRYGEPVKQTGEAVLPPLEEQEVVEEEVIEEPQVQKEQMTADEKQRYETKTQLESRMYYNRLEQMRQIEASKPINQIEQERITRTNPIEMEGLRPRTRINL